MSKHNKPKKRYLFEEVLDLLRHNAGRALNYKQIGAGLEIELESERFQIIEILDQLKQQGFVTEQDRGRYMIKETKTYLSGIIDFTSAGAAYVTV
ncbi:MAG: ribonuclease R, partial [Bacteroidia bacterium]